MRDNEIPGQVLRSNFTAFLTPEAEEGGLVVAHDDQGIGTADEVSPVSRRDLDPARLCRGLLRTRVCVGGEIWARNGISLGHGLPPWLGLELVGGCNFPPAR